LAVAGLATGGIAWSYGDCPNEKATFVPANDVEVGPAQQCDVHIHLFGLEIVIEGPDCYQTIYHFPAHSYCDDAANPDTMCVSMPPLPVGVEHCHCGVSLFGVHVMLPICSCTQGNELVTCPDASTEPCPMVTHPH
jgi:hypothetical protein